jgi:purine-binding chemotaxis protein CheW
MSGTTAGETADEAGGQFLTFTLGAEEYGIEILKVQEIKGYSTITPIPNAPAFLKGVINLRGTIVPVVDLRARFGMAEAEYGKFTVIIVVSLGRKVVGLVVDAVSDVLNVAAADLEPTPDLGVQVDTSFMTGLAKAGDRLVLLLNIERIVTQDELALTAA